MNRIIEYIGEGGCELDLTTGRVSFQRFVVKVATDEPILALTATPELGKAKPKMIGVGHRDTPRNKQMHYADLPWENIDALRTSGKSASEVLKALREDKSVPQTYGIHALEMMLAKHKRELNVSPGSLIKTA